MRLTEQTLRIALAAVVSAPTAALTAAELQLETPQNHGGFFSFAFFPNGKLVVGGTGKVTASAGGRSIARGGDVVVWNAKTGRIEKSLNVGETIDWVQISGDGKTIAAATNETPRVLFWPAAKRVRGPKTIRLRGPFSLDTPPVFSRDGKLLVSVAERERKLGDQTIRTSGELTVWNVAKRRIVWRVKESHVKALALSPDGKTLAGYVKEVHWKVDRKLGGLSGETGKTAITLWDTKKGKPRGEIGDVRRVTRLAFFPDGGSLAGVDGRRLVVWDVESLEEKNETKIESDQIPVSLAFSSDGGRLAIPRFMGKTIDVWDMEKNAAALQLTEEFPTTFAKAAFSAKVDRMACVRGHDPVVIDLE